MGCVLGQHDESGKREQAIYYLSKKFTAYEANYSFLERSCCALAWAAQKLRHYLLSHTTYLISRSDPLKYLLGKPMPTGRVAKWQMILSEFDIIFTTQKAIKGQAVADHLAENPLKDDYQPLHNHFPDEDALFMDIAEDMNDQCPEWRLFFDGGSNSFGAGIGAVLVSPEGKHYPGSPKLRFFCTNNMAEYEACIFGLKMALEMEIKDLLVFNDSDLLVHQTLKEWITRDSKILPYHCSLVELANKFRSLEFRHIPRVRNVFADALATLCSMIQHPDELVIEPIQIHLQEKPAHCLVVEKSFDGRPWYNDIKEFLKTGSYPPGADTTAKSFLRKLSSKFFLNGKDFYWGNSLQSHVRNGSNFAAEVEIPSLRILIETKLEEAEWIQQRHEQLSLIDEKRLNSICHGQCYQKRVARAYNKKVRPRIFTEGDKVLKHILPVQEEAKCENP
nr:uncharacterized protein LOC113722576 [Coffea arabica]